MSLLQDLLNKGKYYEQTSKSGLLNSILNKGKYYEASSAPTTPSPQPLSLSNTFQTKTSTPAFSAKPVQQAPVKVTLGQVLKEVPSATLQVAKKIVDFTRIVLAGFTRVAVSAGEAPLRLLSPKAAATSVPPQKVPGLGALGPIQSYQSAVIDRVNKGESPIKAVAKEVFNLAIDEPIGFAAKPVFLGAGLLFRKIVSSTKLIEQEGLKQALTALSEFTGLSKRAVIKDPDTTIRIASVGNDIAQSLKLQSTDVLISRKVLKHIIESRGENAGNIVKSIPIIISNPDKVADNSIKRAGSLLFVKRLEDNSTAVVFEVAKRPDGAHQVVSAFPMKIKDFLDLTDISGRTASGVLVRHPSFATPKGDIQLSLSDVRDDLINPNTTTKPLQALTQEARKFDNVDAFTKAAGDLFEKRQNKAFNDPYLKIRYTPAEERFLGVLDNFLNSKDVAKLYDSGKRDPEILADFYNQIIRKTQTGLKDSKSPASKPRSLEQTGPSPRQLHTQPEGVSYTSRLADTSLNVNRLKISKEGKELAMKTIDDLRGDISEKIGKVLTHKEVQKLAETSRTVVKREISRESTARWEADLLNTGRQVARMFEKGTIDKAGIEALKALKSSATDIGRKLEFHKQALEPVEENAMSVLLKQVIAITDDMDAVLKAAEGVDFNDPKQAITFFRKFVEPKLSDWVDMIRYNSMLSSPLTQMVNIASTFASSGLIAPIEKTLTGTLDFFAHPLNKSKRSAFAGEGVAFTKGYVTNVRAATKNMVDAMRGRTFITNLDTRHIPIARGGIKGALVSGLSVPTRLLEAMDQFFMTLTEGGEKASLLYRQSKGVKVPLLEVIAKESAQYRVFRQELFMKQQGYILDAIDHMTNYVQMARKSENPIISTIAKFTIPFIQTPMNIFKQGLEYSPLGFLTIVGAKNKTEQLSKAIIGSAVFAGAASLITSDRLTWAEPEDETTRNTWRAAGKQPYSFKAGNKWYSFAKLPPAISFPLAMTASLHEFDRNRKQGDDFVEQVLKAIATTGEFLADQTYAKNFGDLLSAVQGGEASLARLVSNYPLQLVPFRALGGWLARLSDEYQRKVDGGAPFLEKELQLLMMNVPGLSQRIPARLDAEGNPVPNKNRVINAFSPVRISEENAKWATYLENLEEFRDLTKSKSEARVLENEAFQAKFDEIWKVKEEQGDEAASLLTSQLSPEDYATYKRMKQSKTSSETTKAEVDMLPTYKEIQELLEQGRKDEANAITNGMSKEEYRVYKLLKNRVTQ